MIHDPPVPPRLMAVYQYAVRRAAYLALLDTVVAVLMDDLPGLREDRAIQTATAVLTEVLPSLARPSPGVEYVDGEQRRRPMRAVDDDYFEAQAVPVAAGPSE